MDAHDLHLELSLALHAAVAQKVPSQPEIVARARRKMLGMGPPDPHVACGL